MVREESIEGYLRVRVKDADGLCIKLSPAGYVGIPDRLVILPGGWIALAELKKPRGGQIGKLQYWWRRRLIDLGVRHWFLLTRDDVDGFMEDWRNG